MSDRTMTIRLEVDSDALEAVMKDLKWRLRKDFERSMRGFVKVTRESGGYTTERIPIFAPGFEEPVAAIERKACNNCGSISTEWKDV